MGFNPSNSVKVLTLRVLLDICGTKRRVTVPQVRAGLREEGLNLRRPAVGEALMRYSKMGLISRVRHGRWYYYFPNERTEPKLEFLTRAESRWKTIESMMELLTTYVRAEDFPISFAKQWMENIEVLCEGGTVPKRTKKALDSLTLVIATAALKQDNAKKEKAKAEVLNTVSLAVVVDNYEVRLAVGRVEAKVQAMEAAQKAREEGRETERARFEDLDRARALVDALRTRQAREVNNQVVQEGEPRGQPAGPPDYPRGIVTRRVLTNEVREQCFDGDKPVLDVKGQPVYVRFVLVLSKDVRDLEFILQNHRIDPPQDRGLELLEEDRAVIPLLTHGPIAGILPDLCFCDFDIDRLENSAKKDVLKVIEEHGPEIYGLRDEIRKTVIEDQFIPKLAKFFEYFERHRRSKSLWVKPLVE